MNELETLVRQYLLRSQEHAEGNMPNGKRERVTIRLRPATFTALEALAADVGITRTACAEEIFEMAVTQVARRLAAEREL